tara:strand:- start:1753 stop:2520 length:768 start_codon:yes stop_codon:yes gene_type:complete
MKILTTFNQNLYSATGENLIKSIVELNPNINVELYTENLNDDTLKKLYTYKNMQVSELDMSIIDKMLNLHSDKIPVYDGGTLKAPTGYNRRWFQWFRKIVMWYQSYEKLEPGYHIYVDSDIRCIGPCPVNLFSGMRGINILQSSLNGSEAGFIVCEGQNQKIYDIFETMVNEYLSGEIFKYPRVDDGYILTQFFKRYGNIFNDMAKDIKPRHYKNSNGHRTGEHLLPFTKFGTYFQHDKGIHWRKKIVSKIDERN